MSNNQKTEITIYSPNHYTYGAMLMGGILKKEFKDSKINLINNLSPNSQKILSKSNFVIFALYSTLHILNSEIKETMAEIKRKSPNTKIFIAGAISAYPEIILNEINTVDAVIMGEGEYTTPNLIKYFKNQTENHLNNSNLEYLEDFKEIGGIAYKLESEDSNIGNKIIVQASKKNKDIELDFSDLLIPKDIEKQTIRGANVYIETHRGCLGNCTFCQVPEFFGRDIRSKPLELILKEVENLKKRGVKRIAISGGTGSLYNFKKSSNRNLFIEMIEKVSDIIGSKNLSVPDMRVDYVDSDILNAIKNNTVGWVFYGIESGSNKLLSDMKKGTNPEKNLNAIKLAKDCGVKVGGSFIVGYPTEREVDYLMTKDFLVDAELDDIFVSSAEPIPKTRLCNKVIETKKEDNPTFKIHNGIYRKLHLTESEARCFDLLLHAEMWRSVPRIPNAQIKKIYLDEAKTQGNDIRNVTNLVYNYKDLIYKDFNN
ncbi:methyl-coenzyme M reductase glutamine C-methyltransferase [Methanococcus voltae]|uniref:B12-binding domain/radical SAM domain protein n=1 Tax=Methanococcus voltae TaxID=2188 RepID=A0A8J7USE9_METVO|nr:methyl-coenzyme M reductase glutamine C-methyltransferase [Methanococcus voltae]MBP2172526.1 B12-binding domain/radical SAM domain protein [Methanococcus voltae]MBP2201567.1 B12-binding domain/radical SAM domain protein [Methanococcus voltae]